MARMIDILRRLRSDAPGAENNTEAVRSAIDDTLSARPLGSHPEPSEEATLESELRQLLTDDGPLAPELAETQEPTETPEPTDLEAPLSAPAVDDEPVQPAPLDLDATEPLVRAEADAAAPIDEEPDDPSAIVSQAEREALLAPMPALPAAEATPDAPSPSPEPSGEELTVAMNMAAEIENDIESLAEANVPPDGPASEEPEPIESAAEPEALSALPEESAPSPESAEEPEPFLPEAVAEPETGTESATAAAPTEAAAGPEASPPPEPADLIDSETKDLLAEYGIRPDDLALPTGPPDPPPVRAKLSPEDFDAERKAMLAEMGLDMDELRAEEMRMAEAEAPVETDSEESTAQGPEEIDAETEKTLDRPADTPAASADPLDDFKDRATSAPESSEPLEEEPVETPLPPVATAPVEAFQQSKPKLEEEFEAEIASETEQASTPDKATPAVDASPEETGPVLAEEEKAAQAPEEIPPAEAAAESLSDSGLPTAEPVEEEEEPVPAAVVTIEVDPETFRAELMPPEPIEPEGASLDNPVELVKILIGLLSVVVMLVLMIAWFFWR